jgi:hypothetical protein
MTTSIGPEGQAVDTVLPDVRAEIVIFNDESPGHEDLWTRTRQRADQVRQAEAEAREADRAAAAADGDHKAIQAEDPDRTAPRVRQWFLAAGALVLDGVACYFAAEALGGSQFETLAWAALFLALLGAAEVTLDLWRESHPVLWRWTVAMLGVFIGLLCVLRFWFLATVGVDGLVSAAAGAGLFTMLTAVFVIIGYRALRAAETGEAWRARRRTRALVKAAATAWQRVRWLRSRRDRLASAYLSRIRIHLIRTCTTGQLTSTEDAVRRHLIGEDRS